MAFNADVECRRFATLLALFKAGCRNLIKKEFALAAPHGFGGEALLQARVGPGLKYAQYLQTQ